MHDVDKPHRRSLRLRDYNYAQAGAYFVTICTWRQVCTLGEVIDDQVRLSTIGEIISSRWSDLPNHHPIELDAFIVMPNHVHGVIVIVGDEERMAGGAGETGLAPTVGRESNRRGTLGTIAGSFKAATTRAAKERGLATAAPLWQRNYDEHVVRSEQALERIRRYIIENPTKWALDQENPARRI
jgi:REP element-mobilizing transposase RayT